MMDNHLNRYLHPNEDVHHVDFDKTNDNIENLVVLTNSQHTTLHNYLDRFNITKLPVGQVNENYAPYLDSLIRIVGIKDRETIRKIANWMRTVDMQPRKVVKNIADTEPLKENILKYNQSKRIDLPLDELKKLLPIMSYSEIAKKFGVSKNLIYKIVKRHDLKTEVTTKYDQMTKEQEYKPGYIPTKEEVEEDLSKYSISAIARKYGFSTTKVYDLIRDYSIDYEKRKKEVDLTPYLEDIKEELKTNSLAKVAAKYGVDPVTIKSMIERTNTKFRTIAEKAAKNAAIVYNSKNGIYPTKQELLDDIRFLSIHNGIDSKYGVSENSVYNWIKRYNISDEELDSIKLTDVDRLKDYPFKDELYEAISNRMTSDEILQRWPLISEKPNLIKIISNYNLAIKDGVFIPPPVDILRNIYSRKYDYSTVAKDYGLTLEEFRKAIEVFKRK